MLKNLPIKLHCGSISAVTAHIPWPNPLTSTIRLNIQSLHLTFHLIPHITETVDLSTANPAKSMTSMAKAFFRDKLASWEETALRESVHPDLASSVDDRMHSMPGSMDPFLHTTDNDEFHSDIDPAGVLIFASLIKRLLASCELDAVDTKITFTYPAHASFTLSLAEIRHRIEGASGDVSESGREEKITQTLEESRKILISGCTVSARDLRPSSPKLIDPSPASPISSNSSPRFPAGSLSPHRSQSASATSSPPLLDEDPQISISQSLATLQLKLTPDPYLPPGSMTNTSPAYSEATDSSSHRRITPSLDDHICHPETNPFQSASS
jgi:autophagy-related protein 2